MATRLAILSSYSLYYSTIRAEELFARLKAWGIDRLAVTDRDNLYAYPLLRSLARESGITLIAAAALSEGDELIYAFVECEAGWQELSALLTHRNLDPTYSYRSYLQTEQTHLTLATSSPHLLSALKGTTPNLFGAITPTDLRAVAAARMLGIGLLACDNAYLLSENDRPIHHLLRAIGTNATLQTETTATREGLLLDPRSWQEAFSSWPESIENSETIAAYDPFTHPLIFPDYPGDDAPAELRRRVYIGAEQRYGELNDAILSRIDYELAIIEAKGFAPYFLVMHDIVQMSSRTCGRGSGAASIVSYALSITAVDPLAHHLYFERFLSPSRVDMPDIDVDFAWDERDGVFDAVYSAFGRDHCARVANHLFFRPDSALRETAKAYGLSDSQISAATRSLTRPVDDPLWHTIAGMAKRIIGLPRGLSMHCGGLVITPRPTVHYAPTTCSSDGQRLLVWDKEGCEEAGFVKIDLLGNRSLAVIRDTLSNLEDDGITIDERTWRPSEDPKTIAALARGDSMGVFYIESPAMRQLQKKTGRGDFDHIVIHSSIIRPAANAFINTYIERLNGKPYDPLHPRLAAILDETYGILCYQEDVSKVAVALAGFSEADADKLRKVIAKKAGGEKLRSYREQFYEGCRSHRVDEPVIEAVWAMMLSFDGYPFCKPHSASYAMVSFQSAYLRTHHPSHFMAAVLTNGGGYYEAGAYISEARRMGITTAGPDVNSSQIAYRASANTLTIGLMAIANLSRSAMEAIIEERGRGGPFVDLTDLARRLPLSREDLAALTQSGSTDSLAPALRRSEQLRTLLTTCHNEHVSEQVDLFGPSPAPKQTLPQRRARRTIAELEAEYTALGFLRDHHPLILSSEALSCTHRIRASDLARHVNRPITLIGCQITRKQVRTKGGDLMSFISFEDETALYETVLFPDLYERYFPLLYRSAPLLVSGVVKNDHGALIVEVSHLAPLKACLPPKEVQHSSYERIPTCYQ